MARICQITGKKTTSGNNRPFSMKATKRTFRPNLFTKRVLNPLTGKVGRMKLSAKAIRTLKKWAREAGQSVEVPTAATAKPTKNEDKHRVKKEKLTPKQKKEAEAKKAEAATEQAKPEVVKEMEAETKTEEK